MGATFTVKLPLLERPKDRETEGQGEPHRLTHSSTLSLSLQILVIDDEPDSRDFVAFVLEQAGATVITATTATEGLVALTQFLPDVLVSDVGMLDINGYMLMQQVRALPADQGGQVKAIALTAYAGDFNRQRALQSGFQQHVSKPVEPEELVRAIHALLTG
nr:response regulator [Oculatella sp. LEGE 06141]